MKNILNLAQRVGWGNEIHIDTVTCTYAGSGRCYIKGQSIIDRRPSVEEFKSKNVRASGFCSTPYVKNGDRLFYKFRDGNTYLMEFRKVEYSKNVHDLFHADVILLGEYDGIKGVKKKPKSFKIYWLVQLIKILWPAPPVKNPYVKDLGNGWRLGSFDWNPVRGKWLYISFHQYFTDANEVTAACWKAFDLHFFSIRIQTNA